MRMADGISPKLPGQSAAGSIRATMGIGIDKQAAVPLNSAANPLPTTLYGPKIPLSTGPANQPEVTDLSRIFDVNRAHFAG
jgi:hypothetical protein